MIATRARGCMPSISPIQSANGPSRPRFSSIAFQRQQKPSPGLQSDEIDSILSKPTWSVRSLLPTSSQVSKELGVAPKQLHHLLRLSALPQPETLEEESNMLRTLDSQLHFVREIQNVDTAGIEPLQSIRDETQEAEKENEITVEQLKEAFAKEEVIGSRRRIKRRRDLPVDTKGAEDWDVLGQASKKVGRYFVVDSEKD
ncbi:MAG: hypothetical protein M1827_005140 [Pycnora praestabilis]|nr:MAG: hypothetical protein M1827_005140 [Pycnora praestabilis]